MGDRGCIYIHELKRRKTAWFKGKKWEYMCGYGYEWEERTEASHTKLAQNKTVHEAGKPNNPGTGAAGKSHVGLLLLTA
jgi:hypothetical protein